MQGKGLPIIFIFVCIFMLQGCETLKGAGKGFQKDTKVLFQQWNDEDSEIRKTDAWIQENLW